MQIGTMAIKKDGERAALRPGRVRTNRARFPCQRGSRNASRDTPCLPLRHVALVVESKYVWRGERTKGEQ